MHIIKNDNSFSLVCDNGYIIATTCEPAESARETLHEAEETAEKQAREFWRDLRGTYGYNPDGKDTHGTININSVVQKMKISADDAERFLWVCTDMGLTDRQGGGWVI